MEELINGFISVGITVLSYLKITPYMFGQILAWIIVIGLSAIVLSFAVEFMAWLINLVYRHDEDPD